MPCSVVLGYRHFRGPRCLHLQGEALLSSRTSTASWLENLGVDGMIILEMIVGKWGGKVWIGCTAQDRDQWRALVNTLMNFPVP